MLLQAGCLDADLAGFARNGLQTNSKYVHMVSYLL